MFEAKWKGENLEKWMPLDLNTSRCHVELLSSLHLPNMNSPVLDQIVTQDKRHYLALCSDQEKAVSENKQVRSPGMNFSQGTQEGFIVFYYSYILSFL